MILSTVHLRGLFSFISFFLCVFFFSFYSSSISGIKQFNEDKNGYHNDTNDDKSYSYSNSIDTAQHTKGVCVYMYVCSLHMNEIFVVDVYVRCRSVGLNESQTYVRYLKNCYRFDARMDL